MSEWKDLEILETLAGRWGHEDILTEKDSLYANILSACNLIRQEIQTERAADKLQAIAHASQTGGK